MGGMADRGGEDGGRMGEEGGQRWRNLLRDICHPERLARCFFHSLQGDPQIPSCMTAQKL